MASAASRRVARMVGEDASSARGEVDLKVVGRIDKRAKAAPRARWYRGNTRPLLTGASVGHVRVTAGTIGGFVMRGRSVCMITGPLRKR